jgi:hypothetical protein
MLKLDRFVADLWVRNENSVADAVWAQQRLRRAEVFLPELQYCPVFGQPLSYAVSLFKWDSRKCGS